MLLYELVLVVVNALSYYKWSFTCRARLRIGIDFSIVSCIEHACIPKRANTVVSVRRCFIVSSCVVKKPRVS